MTALLCGGCSGEQDAVFDYCPAPNAILAFAYVPNPALQNVEPPRDSVNAPLQSDIIITSSLVPPENYVPLANATVTVLGTILNVRTGDSGLFSFASLTRGVYELQIEAEGHRPLRFHATACEQSRESRERGSTPRFPVTTVVSL